MSSLAMTGLDKVAVLLKSLPADVVDKVMRHLEPRHAGMIKSALAKVEERKDLGPQLAGVIEEAVNILADPTARSHERPDNPPAAAGNGAASGNSYAAKGPGAKAPTVDMRIESKTEENAPLPRPSARAAHAPPATSPAPSEVQADPFIALAGLSADLVAAALDTENTRTASLLMSCLPIECASQIYKRLSPAKRKEVSLRFTEQTVVAEELVKRIAQGVLKKCIAVRDSSASASTEPGGREKRMAALLRGLERSERAEMLAALEQTDAELTGRIKSMLYQFEDILRMENISVQKLLSEVDVKSLSLALRGAPPEIEEKILSNLSKRAQESLREEISLTGAVPAAKVRTARQSLVEAIQKLDQRGELIINE